MSTLLLIVIYVAFVGLGVPDSLFGAAWPAVYADFSLPVSWGSAISMIGCLGTITSSLFSSQLINRLGTGKVTAVSTALTAVALLGFAVAPSFLWMCLLSVPLGLGAGAIDTGLNNYVALHYHATHMNFLHCAYGVGITLSPYLMSLALAGGSWRNGYFAAAAIQVGITLLTVAILPLWGKVARQESAEDEVEQRSANPLELVRRRDVRLACLIFVCSVAIEGICNSWATTYLVRDRGMGAGEAAGMVTVYFMGMTLGRLFSGLSANRVTSRQLVGAGQDITLVGALVLLAPLPLPAAAAGLFLVSFGNGPLYPNMLHLTPRLFGRDLSQAVIGVQMAASYVGSLAVPPLFGLMAQELGFWLFPVFLLVLCAAILSCFAALMRLTARAKAARATQRA